MQKLSVLVAVSCLAVSVSMAAPDGQAIYKEKCVKCHGDKGQGEPKATETVCEGVPLAKLKLDSTATKSDAEVKKQLEAGTENMPGYKGKMSAEEIDAVIAFVRTLFPKK